MAIKATVFKIAVASKLKQIKKKTLVAATRHADRKAKWTIPISV
jgi:hypothetical protein